MKIPDVDAKIDDIKNDKITGSSILSRRAAECIDEFANEILNNHTDLEPEAYLNELTKICYRLVSAQPTMAAVLNGVNDILTTVKLKYNDIESEIKGDQKKQLDFLCIKTQAVARQFILESKLAQETIANSYSEILENSDGIMTISASGAVEMLLTTAAENSLEFTVYTPESRPMFEGRLLAQRLASKGIDCILIADHAMFHFLNNCTKVIVGADRVIPNGILNKIGTSGLALAAKENEIPFYCACECFKFVPDLISMEMLNPMQPESQLYYPTEGENKPESLKVLNIFFDFTSIKYIERVLTDCGLMDSNQVKDYIQNVKILPELMLNID
jgi:translation initiation factor 2B subunit (eIF-2B alpha/beta/delta family)